MSRKHPIFCAHPTAKLLTARDRNNAANFYPDLLGVERGPQERERGPVVNRTPQEETEDQCKLDVARVLREHPKVLFAERRNSGALFNASGTLVQFAYTVREPEELLVVDFTGLLTDGRPFAFECKRLLWTFKGTERETKQLAYINMIQAARGVADFVTSGIQCQAILNDV